MAAIRELTHQIDTLLHGVEQYRERLAALPPGGTAYAHTQQALHEAETELHLRQAFRVQLRAALEACRQYRLNPTRQAFQALLAHYQTLLVHQPDPLARLLLKPQPSPTVIVGCRACAATLLRGLEQALGNDVKSEEGITKKEG
jgi:hypothetical protein